MKRSQMKRKILKELKTWENCKMESRTAEAILSLIEKAGMLPPGQKEDTITFSKLGTGEVLGSMYSKHEWEPEK